jgi:mono/diheme cytochrome c family protein
MHQAPRYDPLEASDFFADGRASRPLVAGTIPRGFLRADAVFYTGKQGTAFVTDIPVPITRDLVKRGQGRFNIYCSPCHGVTGDGNGTIVQRGFKQPPSYHSDRLRAQPAGYIYDVITNGFGAMQDYSAQVAPADRWAVVAYVRTLQFSRNVKATDLPASDRERLERKTPAGGQTHD